MTANPSRVGACRRRIVPAGTPTAMVPRTLLAVVRRGTSHCALACDTHTADTKNDPNRFTALLPACRVATVARARA